MSFGNFCSYPWMKWWTRNESDVVEGPTWERPEKEIIKFWGLIGRGGEGKGKTRNNFQFQG